LLYEKAEVTFVRESHLDEWSMLMFESLPPPAAISRPANTVLNCG
jgi:hypothetical protein